MEVVEMEVVEMEEEEMEVEEMEVEEVDDDEDEEVVQVGGHYEGEGEPGNGAAVVEAEDERLRPQEGPAAGKTALDEAPLDKDVP